MTIFLGLRPNRWGMETPFGEDGHRKQKRPLAVWRKTLSNKYSIVASVSYPERILLPMILKMRLWIERVLVSDASGESAHKFRS
jgi:hypothetical protein